MDQKLFSQTVRSIRRKIRTAKKYHKKALSQLTLCQMAEEKEHIAKLLQSVIYQNPTKQNFLEAYDWKNDNLVKIDLNPKLSSEEEMSLRFKEVRKLKKGMPYAEAEYNCAEQELQKWNQALTQVEAIATDEQLEDFRKTLGLKSTSLPVRHLSAVTKRYKEYLSSNKIPILVGKNAPGNEELTFKYANGNDLWLHVADYSGSHVVIHPNSSQKIDENTLYEAMQLALYHSQAKNLKEAEISYTLVKYVKKMGKLKGKVQIANESRRKIYLDTDLIATLPRL